VWCHRLKQPPPPSRLRARKISACEAGCTCTPTSACGKEYTKVVAKVPLIEFGFVFGVVLATLLFVAILYTLYNHTSTKSQDYEALN
jgi:hypothetical protein